MSGIAGIIRWTPGSAPDQLTRIIEAMAYWGPDGRHTIALDNATFAYFHMATTPEDAFVQQPCTLASGELFVAAARLDNRTELCDALQIESARRATMADSALVAAAYLRWGQASVNHLYGDWSFAVWDPKTHHLFMARDQLGQTALYYHANQDYFAFASSNKALLALDPALHAIDDVYVAQVLLSWPVYHGPRTVYTNIQRLPPAHALTAAAGKTHTTHYWRAEDVELLPLRSRAEAVEGFLTHYEQAVRTRLRANGSISATLSGGLDSGSVTSLAAPMLAAMGQSLTAYTSVPIGPNYTNTDFRFGNEWEMAAQTAAFAGITDHQPIDARDTSPLTGIDISLAVHEEPQHAASNAYWIVSLLRKAKADGHKVLLTGQGGNATVSWVGSATRRVPDLKERVRDLLVNALPQNLATQLRVWKIGRQAEWRTTGVVNHDLVRRLRVLEKSAQDPDHPMHTYNARELAARLAIIKPGRSIVGAIWNQSSAAFGIEVRDPTSDVRLVKYCLAIPDELYYDPATRMDRAIIRQAMDGRMPDAVRLNRQRGLQGADLPYRLRLVADEVEARLEQLAKGKAANYLNIENLRQAWAYIQQHDDPKAYREGTVILVRGLMAGQFVQEPPLRALNVHTPRVTAGPVTTSPASVSAE